MAFCLCCGALKCWLIVEVVQQMKMELKKARLLVADVQQSCIHHQQVAAAATKQSRLALNDVCASERHSITLFLIFPIICELILL